MSEKITYLDLTGLHLLKDKIKEFFVAKEENKGLSTNDYTDSDKQEVSQIKNKADATDVTKLQEIIDRNKEEWSKDTTYTLATDSKAGLLSSKDKNKLDGLKNITNISELINDKNFQSKEEILTLIRQSQHLSKEVVEMLPDIKSAKDNVIYLVPKKEKGKENVYDEYMAINDSFEKIGDTETKVDLVGYVKQDELDNYAKKTQLDLYMKEENIAPIGKDEILQLFK